MVDIFRMKDGRIVEHRDVIQPVPEKASNANTMFDQADRTPMCGAHLTIRHGGTASAPRLQAGLPPRRMSAPGAIARLHAAARGTTGGAHEPDASGTPRLSG